MDLTEDEIFEHYAKQGKHCQQKTRLPYEDELTRFS